MNGKEKDAMTTFRSVTENFLGNKKDPDSKKIVETILKNFKMLGCKISVKNFLHSHTQYFPENLDILVKSKVNFHQDIKEMEEERYQGKWNETMMADYCWMLKSDCKDGRFARKSKKRKFEN